MLPIRTILRPADLSPESAVGTLGRSGFRRILMGSAAGTVNRGAACPVATARGGAKPIAEPGRPADAGAGPEHWRTAPGDDPFREVSIPAGGVALAGTLWWPHGPRGVVVFAHGSGGSKRSPGNRITAALLTGAGFATLLVDLLADAERDTLRPTPDAVTLSERVAAAAEWVTRQPETAGLPVGYFGANTGGAAVLIAAARHPALVSAVVCRGGRTDLARDDLAAVRAPTLLISGWEDEPVFDWNQAALGLLTCTKQLAAVPGATHSFAEPGAVEKVAELARDWFERHLPNVLRAGAEVVG